MATSPPRVLIAIPSAHVDRFAHDRLPPPALQPEFLLDDTSWPPTLNCAAELLDGAIERGWGERACLRRRVSPWPWFVPAISRRSRRSE